MKIGFNAYFLKGLRAGIGRYSWNVLEGLRKIALNDRFSICDNPLGLNKFLFEQVYLPFKLWQDRPAVFFSPSMILPFWGKTPSVMVVYDLVFDLFPQYYRGLINQLYLKLFFAPSLLRAKKIIAISESTKMDLVNIYQVPPEKVRVIHLAAAEEYKIITDQARLSAIKRKYSLPDNYLLFVGTVEPRKNVRGLLQAYFSLPLSIRERHRLVICGQKGWGYKVLQAWLQDQPARDEVVFLNYVDEADLPAIYNQAALFVYPSFYEGFGLPVLEAMACGVPTITSKTSSIPEVAGDAAILIDPNDPAQLAEKISQVLADNALAEELRANGLKQASKFSWQKTAQETMKLIKELEKK